mmetsp:Transcript_82525/g.238446  ORF Transcript_82525/g.238446 Transcript_82525/m.238446 type:complete len:195 (+) Transcript_82525:117-701(+)
MALRLSALALVSAFWQEASGNIIVMPRDELAFKPPRLPSELGGALPPPRGLMLFDCKADFLDMRGWSDVKKEWCCQRHSAVCKGAEERQADQADAAFDCEEGWANWLQEWSLGKQAWCCARLGRGCRPERELLQPAPPQPQAAEQPAPAPAQKSPDSEDFDCHSDVQDMTKFWSGYKRDYCCRAYGVGCANIAV